MTTTREAVVRNPGAPLRPENVTIASRIMLPTYPLLCAVIGANYAFTPRERLTETPALAGADSVVPLPAWGALFLAVAAIQIVTLLSHSRLGYIFGLAVMCAAMLLWAVVFAVTAVVGTASPSTCVWPLFAAVACWASIRSLSTREAQ